MGISFRTIDTVAKWAETSGFKSILQKNPIKAVAVAESGKISAELSKVNFGEMKLLKNDAFVRSNPFFVKMTEAENALLPKELHNTKMGAKFAQKIPTIRELPYEKSYMYNQNDKLIGRSFFGGKVKSVTLSIRPQYLVDFDKASCGLIHNHPTASTLSIQDLKSFFQYNIQTIMATTPTSGYSAISKISNPKMNLFKNPKFAEMFKKLESKTDCAFTKINIEGLQKGQTTLEIYKNQNQFMDEQIKKLVNRVKEFVDLKYDYKPTEITSKNIKEIDGYNNLDAYKAEYIKKGCPQEDMDKYFTALTEAPLKTFYI